MNDDSYSTDNVDNENDSESSQRQGTENGKPKKQGLSRCFNV